MISYRLSVRIEYSSVNTIIKIPEQQVVPILSMD